MLWPKNVRAAASPYGAGAGSPSHQPSHNKVLADTMRIRGSGEAFVRKARKKENSHNIAP
ncbi:MAG: hypothetical protein ACXVMS_04770 [Flavisolibacter sp.]